MTGNGCHHLSVCITDRQDVNALGMCSYPVRCFESPTVGQVGLIESSKQQQQQHKQHFNKHVQVNNIAQKRFSGVNFNDMLKASVFLIEFISIS